MKRLTYILLIGVLALSLGRGNVFAQATASVAIQGTITDKSGAVVSGVQVVAKNKATDLTRTTTTSETGYYRFELLPVGTYTVSVTKAGFGAVAQTVETWRFRLFSGRRSQIETPAVEVNRVNEILFVPESPSCVFDPLDLRVERFARSIGDAMP